jgi:hypothetical protein
LDNDDDDDGIPDASDPDANGNGILDNQEDADGDGCPDLLDYDTDGDGINDNVDDDDDNDGILDDQDDDDNNDGILDKWNDAISDDVKVDSNGDGIPDKIGMFWSITLYPYLVANLFIYSNSLENHAFDQKLIHQLPHFGKAHYFLCFISVFLWTLSPPL